MNSSFKKYAERKKLMFYEQGSFEEPVILKDGDICSKRTYRIDGENASRYR